MTESEFNKARAQRVSERAQQGYAMKNMGNMPSFADTDADGNGTVSKDEFAAHQASHHPR